MKKVPEQLLRLGTVIGIVVAIVLTLRFVVLPAHMFQNKPHQHATMVREMEKPVHHAGMVACRQCHEDVYETKYAGFHKTIACENCHGPAEAHAADPKGVKVPKPTQREFCYACHAFDPSRPNGFPQIDPTAHKPGKRCIACHDPHDPAPPSPIKDCSGCHGVIWKTKAQSSHAEVECTTCHQVSDKHFEDPRSALPGKPTTREFCGQCHGKDATDATAKKVDLATHGKSYLCWDCHYPHAPEKTR